MSQPQYVHITETDEVRPVDRLPAARSWTQSRVAELVRPGQPRGRMFGDQGPDQGYAHLLAERFEDDLRLAPGESGEDALSGCIGVAMARASLFGRAPVKADLELALTLFGYLGGAPDDLITARLEWFKGCAHDYWAKLAVKSLVPESTLRLTPSQVRDSLAGWQSLLASE